MRRTHNEKLVDKLSRATASQDGARGSDVLGNSTMISYSGNVQRTFDWDCLNRLLDKKASGVVQASYNYRADGMRVGKYVASGNKTTVYRYDGQMGIEDVETSPGTSTVTDYAIGARGVDGISTSVNGAASTVAYPIYDAHGNMVATLAKGGSNTYSVGNQRSYDAWGGIRIGNLTGDPKQQYCANLGHRADDETGFIYMRARYYEPSTARFLSEDLARHGLNSYSYSSNNPVDRSDESGQLDGWTGGWGAIGMTAATIAGCFAFLGDIPAALFSAKMAILAFTILFLGDIFLQDSHFTAGQKAGVAAGRLLLNGLSLGGTGVAIPQWMNGWLSASAPGLQAGERSSASQAVTATFMYSLAICGALMALEVQ